MIVSLRTATHPVLQRASTSHLDIHVSHLDTLSSRRSKRQRTLTWAVEPLASGDIKHGPSDSKQDPPTVVPIKLCEGARGIRRKEQRRSVRAGHPRVASVAFRGGFARDSGGGEEDALEGIQDA
jgi:hypothetical protein